MSHLRLKKSIISLYVNSEGGGDACWCDPSLFRNSINTNYKSFSVHLIYYACSHAYMQINKLQANWYTECISNKTHVPLAWKCGFVAHAAFASIITCLHPCSKTDLDFRLITRLFSHVLKALSRYFEWDLLWRGRIWDRCGSVGCCVYMRMPMVTILQNEDTCHTDLERLDGE